jgi:outer membrane lipoprotein-sorting protein
VLALFATPTARADDWSLDALFAARQQIAQADATFEQERHSLLLDAPLRSTGTLHYQKPDQLEQRIDAPYPSTTALRGDLLSMQKDGQTRTISLVDYPQAGLFASALRALLGGDGNTLREHFELAFSGTRDDWQLKLTPLENVHDDQPALGPQLAKIEVRGSAAALTQIELQQSPTERTLMRIREQSTQQ